MNPKGTLEFRPMINPPRVDAVYDPEGRHKARNGPTQGRGRRLFKRKWFRRVRRRALDGSRIDQTRLLSASDERALAERVKAGDVDAEQTLVTANLGLVLKAVNDYRQCGVPEDDLIQEGNLGLIRAARHFDPSTHATRFATYAIYWIRCFMVRALDSNSSLIQRPEKSRLLRAQYRRALHELEARRTAAVGEPDSPLPSLDEITHDPGVASGSVIQARPIENERAICQRLSDLTLAEGPAPDQNLVNNEDRALVCAALWRLSTFEAWVICERFGLREPSGSTNTLTTRLEGADFDPDSRAKPTVSGGFVPAEEGRASDCYFQRSYRDMGRECGLSVFRLRQVEKTALDKLRSALAAQAPERT